MLFSKKNAFWTCFGTLLKMLGCNMHAINSLHAGQKCALHMTTLIFAARPYSAICVATL